MVYVNAMLAYALNLIQAGLIFFKPNFHAKHLFVNFHFQFIAFIHSPLLLCLAGQKPSLLRLLSRSKTSLRILRVDTQFPTKVVISLKI